MARLRPRIVVVESAYYQQEPQGPVVVESRFSRWLESDNPPVIRRSNATSEWSTLCWLEPVDSCSLLIIQNLESPQSFARCLDIGLHVGGVVYSFASLRPGEALRFCPTKLPSLRIRSYGEAARYMAALLPT
jgi:hypothetical protein